MRKETRRMRYDRKQATTMPVYVATINFGHDANIAYVIRAAACFGAKEVFIIGNTLLTRDILNDLSGSAYDYIDIKYFSYPGSLVEHCKRNNIKLISMELPDDIGGIEKPVHSIHDYKFNFVNQYCIVVGNETTGIPVDILMNSDIIYVPMPGKAYCLNTAMAANVALFEISKQYCLNKSK